MSTISPSTDHAHGHGSGHHHHESYLASKGSFWANVWNWATTVDHKKIGVMYLAAVLVFFFIGGVLAIALRTELWNPVRSEGGHIVGQLFGNGEGISVGNRNYNRIFTLHGAVMVFMVIIPSIPAALGNILIPLMLGAKDVAFPRLNLLSWYIYLFGSIFAGASILVGGVDTGWTFYTPYSTTTDPDQWRVIFIVAGAFIIGFSSILTGLNFIVTVHKLRAPGVGWFDMPLFVWAMYATSIIQVLATPVIGITLLLLLLERFFHVGIFDPTLGGDPVLFQHFFWFYSHPVVYVMILPGMAIISEIIPVHARKKIFGYRAIAFASFGIAAVAFLVWGHHMFTSEGELAATIFSALTFLVAIPTAVKVFNWILTLYRGSIALTTPMVYALMFLFLFSIGGLTGLPLGALATDLHLHDSYFVVAHFHYVMMGGTIIAFVGGLHHWWPKIFGRMYNERAATIGAIIVFIGFNLTFFTQFFMGVRGMPRRYASYVDEFHIWHQVSTVGSYILLVGFLWHAVVFLLSIRGPKAPANPWGALTLEWLCSSPPIEHNFEKEPVYTHGPYDYGLVVPFHCTEEEYPLASEEDRKKYAHH
jgi:cytochrome c oxidase subunit 1